ncbi:hypothetical protein AAJ76_4800012433 [Vairimorpha ceranae]|uniref:Uncharacterized protein n=1 Tax=Vairimorpha ceranae TaxID=40302 RepID=A0A0F9WD33_9MICR|nr:hypothetical protein AAJ76_4800012433 [Vairimorpha ceranae]KKO74740.1 hypothetical protein AAJ76_4800012433 [Vairimorpha ceranae]
MIRIVLTSYANSSIFSIPRCVIGEAFNECNACLQAQPSKAKEMFKHILAKTLFERLVIDLVDTRIFAGQNDGLGLIFTGIDVKSKYIISYVLKGKNVNDVFLDLKMAFYKLCDP